MPTYQYSCTQCGHFLEAVQKFTDDALTDCPECGGRLRKVFNAVGVVFKGSGFYRTDSRSSTSASEGAAAAKSGTKEPAAAAASSSGSGSTSGSTSGASASSSTSTSD
ncbi:MAG TPA: FmdB family zinc ribbon protein [Marmoricola sp.]|nr:FmdB family zinc ribbon protein [Marmoricola sp.]